MHVRGERGADQGAEGPDRRPAARHGSLCAAGSARASPSSRLASSSSAAIPRGGGKARGGPVQIRPALGAGGADRRRGDRPRRASTTSCPPSRWRRRCPGRRERGRRGCGDAGSCPKCAAAREAAGPFASSPPSAGRRASHGRGPALRSPCAVMESAGRRGASHGRGPDPSSRDIGANGPAQARTRYRTTVHLPPPRNR